jgi:UDP-N-acetylglucosamine--N-acetylmuramyl-(pentapeptide) pyrophosphoryl-undecaprenol N-acetylglucosamine transferase
MSDLEFLSDPAGSESSSPFLCYRIFAWRCRIDVDLSKHRDRRCETSPAKCEPETTSLENALVLVAAGGTGGHLFPAEAASAALRACGCEVELVTDARAAKYGASFPARAIHEIGAATPSGKSPLERARAALVLAAGTVQAWRLIRRLRPCAVLGFGGYPTVPPVLAASLAGVPTILHEANAVMGRANRFLAPRVDGIAKGFEALGGVNDAIGAKARLTGNPVRPMVLEAAKLAYPALEGGILRLLVTGGSQGARIMSDIVPAAIELIPDAARHRLVVIQQARGEDLSRVRATYTRLGIKAEVESFFNDLPLRIARSHLVIGRAGASTVSELAVIGRPAVLVPLPHSLDQDQAANARQFAACGAGTVIDQSAFSPQWLASFLGDALADPEGLARGAAEAKRTGIVDAADRLAQLVLEMIAERRKKP